MKKSLTVKMFITLFTSFALLIMAIMLFLYLYFNYSYLDSKINRMTQAIDKFSVDYVQGHWDESEIYRNLANFNDSYNTYMYIYDSDGAYYFEDYQSYPLLESNISSEIDNSFLVTVSNNDVFYDITLNTEDYNSINIMNLEPGSPMQIEGFIIGDQTMVPLSINGKLLTTDNRVIPSEVDETELQTFDINYVSTNIFSNSYSAIENSEAEFGSDILAKAGTVDFQELIIVPDNENTYEKNGVIYEISELPYTEIELVYLSKQVISEERIITFSTDMSLQSVSEVVGVMTSFLPWFLFGAILMAFAISLFYSRTVSRPIIKITKAADSMAAMELDTKSDIKRHDELGRLSDSLNTLSSNLSNAMDELVVKNMQLAEDNALKERQEESRKTFIANASHELKTPLGVIKGYTEAIKDGIKEEKKEYYMDVILDEITHMDKLLVEMMQLSKVEAVADKLTKETVDVDSLFSKVIEKLTPAAQKAKLNFSVKTPLGAGMGDAKKLYQVIYNLAANAVKYSNPKTIIEVESIQKDGNNVIYIKNYCQPLSENDLKHIWERFYKVDTSHTRESEGSGLGLAIVKSILEAHDSEYGVYNTGNGICFHFSIPQS